MTNTFRKLIVFILVFVIVILPLLKPTLPAYAWATYNNTKWSPTSLPLKVTLEHVETTGVEYSGRQYIVTKEQWQNEIRKAMKLWNDEGTALQFVEVPANEAIVDIVMAEAPETNNGAGFTCFKRSKNDSECNNNSIFNGQYYNYVVIKMHRMAVWDIHDSGFNVFHLDPQTNVAHEFGHVLGLAHTSENKIELDPVKNSALMAKSLWKVHRWLSDDDKEGLRHLYGPVVNPPVVPTVTNAQLIGNITVPDGTVVSPNQSLLKTWRLNNTGSSSWGSGYQLVFLRGDRMGAPSAIDVPTTTPGQNVDLNISFTAPPSPGNYKGYWRLRNPEGTYFGPEIWVEINAKASSSSITLLETDPVSPATTDMVRIHARADNYPNLRAMRVKIDGVIMGELGAPEIWVDWGTAGYASGAHNVVVEVASSSDLNWTSPDVKGTTFVLEGNSVSTNHAPNPPALTNPGDWAVYEGTGGITLSAKTNGDPDGDAVNQYYFEIYNSHDIPNSGWINSNSWSPPGLSIYGYQWHAKVRDSRGAESGWSETRHFTVNNPELQIYSFSSQTCRSSWNQGDPDKICFCAQTNAGGLQLQLNSATDGSASGTWKVIDELATPNYNCNLDTDSPPTIDPKELESGTHLVRLYAQKSGGWAAAKTADTTISVGNLRPNPPMAKVLTNEAYTNSQDVSLAWNATRRTTNYRVEVSTDESYATHITDQTLPANQTRLDFHLPSAFSTVYWKVTANGPYGSNSASNVFHVDVTPPNSSLSVTSNTVYENNFAVNWSGSDTGAGLQWYHLQVKDGSRLDEEWKDWLVNTTQTAAIFEGQLGHTYLIRIRPMDKVGNWQAWPAWDGAQQVSVKIDPTTRPPDPWWNSNYAYKRGITVLNNDGDWLPAHYPVHIQFNANTNPTATEIYNSSLSSVKGNDLRVIYNNTTELNRFIQRFGSDQIDIWFPNQNGLGGGGSDTTSYQIYYGNTNPGNPSADINAIFLPVSDGNTIGLWHFQEGSGNSVYDSSGRGHNGYFYNASWADGLLGRTGSFNGSNAYVEIPHSSELNPGAITLEAWIYLTGNTLNHPMIISKDYYYIKVDNDRKLWFSINANGGGRAVLSGTALNMYQWYHVAGTYDGNGHMKVYVNGREDGHHDEAPLAILTTNLPFRIGRASNTDPNVAGYPSGYIQNVRISNIARTDFSYGSIDAQPSVSIGAQQTPQAQGKPDLAVLSLNAYSNAGGGLQVEAVVKNQGVVSTVNGFFTDLYINHLPTGAGDYTGSLQFWVNDPIPAGATATLTTVITDLSQIGLATASAAVPGEEKHATLYVQTDSTGVLSETDKANNITPSGTGVCMVTADAYEGDGTPTTAPLLDKSQLHNFDRPNDEDWVKLVAKQGQTYKIQTSNLGPNADTYLYLYGSDGTTLLASNDDYNGTLASLIEWTAPADGTFYIQAKQWNSSLSGCGTSYSLGLGQSTIFLPVVVRQ